MQAPHKVMMGAIHLIMLQAAAAVALVLSVLTPVEQRAEMAAQDYLLL